MGRSRLLVETEVEVESEFEKKKDCHEVSPIPRQRYLQLEVVDAEEEVRKREIRSFGTEGRQDRSLDARLSSSSNVGHAKEEDRESEGGVRDLG